MVFQMPHRRQCFEKKFATMKNAVIFVPRTQIKRELISSHLYKAGFFYSTAKGFFPIKRRPAFTERFRNVSARASDCVRSGIGQAAFLFGQIRTQSTHDSSTISRPPRQDRRAAIRIQRQPGGAKAIARTGKRPGNSLKLRDHRSQGAITEARNAFQVVINQINTFFHSFQPSVAAAG